MIDEGKAEEEISPFTGKKETSRKRETIEWFVFLGFIGLLIVGFILSIIVDLYATLMSSILAFVVAFVLAVLIQIVDLGSRLKWCAIAFVVVFVISRLLYLISEDFFVGFFSLITLPIVFILWIGEILDEIEHILIATTGLPILAWVFISIFAFMGIALVSVKIYDWWLKRKMKS